MKYFVKGVVVKRFFFGDKLKFYVHERIMGSGLEAGGWPSDSVVRTNRLIGYDCATTARAVCHTMNSFEESESD